MTAARSISRRRSLALRRLAAALAVCVVLVAGGGALAGPAQAASFGMSDGRPVLFDSADLAALNFQQVRLVLPWNAASHDGSWSTWLTRAQLQGYPILVAPTIDDGHDCAGGDCKGPSPEAYRAALGDLLAKYPGIDAVEAWNEPNHSMQPTAGNPAMAAHYFDAAADACSGGRCTAVAGNLLDVPSMTSYLKSYRAALGSTPAVWGIHDYYDATYFQRSGIDQMLALTSGPVWITEVGGLVTFKSPGGTLPYDEHRAADSLRWMFTLALQEPRIARLYLYGMWQQPTNAFDSALIRVDNSDRESMTVARAYVGPRTVRLPGPQAPLLPAQAANGSGIPGADPATASSTTKRNAAVITAGNKAAASAGHEASRSIGTLKVVGKRVVVDGGRRLRITVLCVGPASCSGHLRIRAGAWTARRSVKLAAARQRAFTLRLPAAAARSLTARRTSGAWAQACQSGVVCRAKTRTPVVAATARRRSG